MSQLNNFSSIVFYLKTFHAYNMLLARLLYLFMHCHLRTTSDTSIVPVHIIYTAYVSDEMVDHDNVYIQLITCSCCACGFWFIIDGPAAPPTTAGAE